MPFSPTGYVPQYGDRIAELMMRQGEIAARGAERSGMIWGRAIENLGQIAGNAVEQHQQQKIAKQKDEGIYSVMQSWDGQDTTALVKGLATYIGPIEAVKVAGGLQKLMEAKQGAPLDASHVAGPVGALAALEKANPGHLQRNWGLIYPEIAPIAKWAGMPVSSEWSDSYTQNLLTLNQQLNPPKAEGALVDTVDAQGRPIKRRATEAELSVGVPTAPPTPKQYQVTVPGPNGPITRLATEAEMQAGVREYQKPTAAESPGYSVGDVKTVVKGMKEGRLPPQLPGRATKEYLAVMAESERQGFDVATAATDWYATQKNLQTLNGAQQLRMRQAVTTARHSFDLIDDLSKQWARGKFPPLNKAKLLAAKAGALGPEAAKIATQLEAQINDVTSELGVVYMGGNSPTDHALELAAKNLSADWSGDVLQAMTDLGRKNLDIRTASMTHSLPVGVSEDNPYGQGGAPAAPEPGGGNAPQRPANVPANYTFDENLKVWRAP